jgi:hypothetical protein
VRSRWLTKRAVLSTLAIAIWAPGCLVAGWWQATVALSGNTLSYLYTVEWPAFAVFGIVVWWHLVHDDPETVGARGLARLRAMGEETGIGAGAPAPPAGTELHIAAAGGVSDGGAAVLEHRCVTGGRAAAADAAAGPPVGRTVPPDGREGARPDAGATDAGEADGDEELRAYNEYLASLAGRPKTWSRR